VTTKLSTKNPGELKVNWDAYWQGFMSNPAIEHVRFDLVKGAYQRLLKIANLPKNPSICELGAGTGKTSRFLGDVYQASITVVDNNSKALAINREIFKDFQGEHRQINSNVLDLAIHEKFDLVHSGGLIEHFVDQARDSIITIHGDLVKPNGYLLVLVPTKNIWYKILNEGIFKSLHLLDQIPEVPWSFQELETALGRHGFRLLAKTTVVTELGVLAQKTS